MHPPRILVLVAILGVLVAGCTPAMSPSPSPVPTVPTCLPEFGGTPFPCTQEEYEQFLRTQARYAEAERIYREYIRLSQEELVARRAEPSDDLVVLIAPDLRAEMNAMRTAELEAQYSGTATVVSSERRQPQPDDDVPLVMAFCLDMSQWTVQHSDGTSDPNTPLRHVVGFREHPEFVIHWLEWTEEPSCAP